MMSEKPVSLRMIQHYMYCPRRFALLELNQDWAENAAVVNANILHETVHSEAFYPSDAIQVYAQKLCADSVWNCDCEAYIYYSSTRKRVKLPFDTEGDYYHSLLLQYLSEMKKISETHSIPPCRKGQVCSNCSLYNDCFPKAPAQSVRGMIDKMWEE